MIKKIEEFTDYIQRLFPQDDGGDYHQKKLVKSVTLQVTDGCNLACTYCYQINKHNNFMDISTAKKFIDLLLADKNPYINTQNAAGVTLEFVGGEPLLAIDLIDEISDYFIDQLVTKGHPWATRFMLSMCTNGVLYFDHRVQEYLKKHKERLSFSISIDGNKDLHDACRVFPDGAGSYDIAIKGALHYMHQMNRHIGSKMTLAPQNIAHTFDAVKNLITLGYEDIFLNCVYEEGWEVKDATTMYYQLKQVFDYLFENDLDEKIRLSILNETVGCPMADDDLENWCGGNGSMIAVDYKGDIFPCLRFMESSLGKVPPLIIGTVDGGIMATSCQQDCVNCLKCVDRKTQSTEECFNCPVARGCGWCSAYNYQTFGTVDHRATYICDMHKARTLANVYFFNRHYQKHGEKKVFKNYMPDEWALKIIGQEELTILKKLEETQCNCMSSYAMDILFLQTV